jgi:hypothetical protein
LRPIAIDVRSVSELSLGYSTPAAFVMSAPGIVALVPSSQLSPGLWMITPLAVGTTTLTATVFGLSASVTVVVDP